MLAGCLASSTLSMPLTPPKVRALALGLLRHHSEGAPPTAPGDALRLGCERLRSQISTLVGPDGYRALLSRAVALAVREHPLLGAAQVDSEGRLTRLEEFTGSCDTVEAEESACAAILANLLALLASFLGTEITRQLLRSAWPDFSAPDADFGAEEGEV